MGEMWHEDIYKVAVKDANNTLLGYIYCDFYLRENKFSNIDCHFTIQCSKQLENNNYQLPIVVLHLNFQPPTTDRPTLLTFGNLLFVLYLIYQIKLTCLNRNDGEFIP